jgi:hypothetical protein
MAIQHSCSDTEIMMIIELGRIVEETKLYLSGDVTDRIWGPDNYNGI